MRIMKPEEAAWVGAMVEAEGSVFPNRTRWGDYWQVRVSNTDLEIISALFRATGEGTVIYDNPTREHLGNKQQWLWCLSKQAEVKSLAASCQDYCIKLRKVL
ncbi:hypothetical protein LCGC14_2740840 [marine sediment metagenome]|uniref:Homing endonuclease LAGLIDADG domain-containing protein n=1 Tax=marine sediment metagenome TaxID=412755 RepID=A0A0F9BW70_9ZZZZ